MGDEYATAYGKSLRLANVRKLNFSDNRLKEKGSYNLVQGLNKNIQELNISNNKIGPNTIDYISK